jgi:hypothetical protein
MNEVRYREVSLGEHLRDVLKMRLDSCDLLFVSRIIGRDLNDAAAAGENEVVRGCGLAKAHPGMRLSSPHNARVMIAFLYCLDGQRPTNKQGNKSQVDFSAHISTDAPQQHRRAHFQGHTGGSWSRPRRE